MLMSIENMQKNVVIFATILTEMLFKKCTEIWKDRYKIFHNF